MPAGHPTDRQVALTSVTFGGEPACVLVVFCNFKLELESGTQVPPEV